MENSLITEKQELGTFDILKEALSISIGNIYFLVFTLTISLPLFFFCVYYEIFLQTTLVESIKFLSPPSSYYNYLWPLPEDSTSLLDKDFLSKLLQLIMLYSVPLQLLELCSMVATIYLASEMYREEKSLTLKDMVVKTFNSKRLRRTFLTSTCVLLWSTCVVVPLIWFAANCYANDTFSSVLYGVAFSVVLFKYMEFSAVWNMGFVISVLEEQVSGIKSLSLSLLLLRRDRKRQGRILMLVFFVWEFGLRLASLSGGWYVGGNAILVQICLSRLGNMIKWVACLVYFYECEKKLLEKKVDEEVGRKAKASEQ